MRRSWIALGIAAVVLLAVGVALGRRIGGSEAAPARPVVTVTVPAPQAPGRRVARSESRSDATLADYARTRGGAVEAATAYLGALDGPVLLDLAAVRRTVTAIASTDSRESLARGYELAARQVRDQLGVGTAPEPVVVIRSAPVGYRVDDFSLRAATVSIWRVGIVGSGATVEPRQSWRTETVSLVWEDATWKVAALSSSPGPTPPLAVSVVTPPAELFVSIPEFEEFTRATR